MASHSKHKKGKKVTMRAKGKKPITFKKGALHEQLGVPAGEPIPASKKRAALSGKRGPLAKKRATFAFKGALAAGRKKSKRRGGKKSNPLHMMEMEYGNR